VGKRVIRITLTRYNKERILGEQYRKDNDFKGTFTEYLKKKKKSSNHK